MHVLFNEVAKKLTGIKSDLIKQSNIVSNQSAPQVIEAGAPAQGFQAQEEDPGRFKLGGGQGSGKESDQDGKGKKGKKGKKGCC